MKLNEYVKKYGYKLPRPNTVINYSQVFNEYYEWLGENFVFIDSKGGIYACLIDEYEEYKRRKDGQKYCIGDFKKSATIENVEYIEEQFANGFNDGFNDIEFEPNLTSQIIDNIVCIINFTIRYGNKGILRTLGFSNEFKRQMLMTEVIAYQEGYSEGKRFKSYFLYIEYYNQFKKLPEPFLRPIQYFWPSGLGGFKFIHFTDNKNLSLDEVTNIKVTDRRLNIQQSKEDLIEFFKTRLIDWYSEEDIEHFLKANFKCFDDKKTRKILISIMENTKGLQSSIYRWTYKFFSNEKYKGAKKIRYAEMLKENFDVFSNSSVNTINTNLSKYKS